MGAPEGYKLVLSDDFDGDTLDLQTWKHRGVGKSACGFDSPSQSTVENGCLVIRGEYKQGEFGEGWYSGQVSAHTHFLRGYFEASVRLPRTDFPGRFYSNDIWGAFWLQARHPYEPELSRGGLGGAELDILELFRDPEGRCFAQSAIHCSGMKCNPARGENKLDSKELCRTYSEDYNKNFHVYALEWTCEEYIFSIDGVETARSTWGDGVSTEPDELIFSLCLPRELPPDADYKPEMFVDWVKVWQK